MLIEQVKSRVLAIGKRMLRFDFSHKGQKRHFFKIIE